MTELITADLVREVQETQGVANSVIAFIDGFAVKLKDLRDQLASVPGTPETPDVDEANLEAQRVIDEAIAQLDAVQADIVAAITANSDPAPAPDEPAPEPEPVPDVPAEPEPEVPNEDTPPPAEEPVPTPEEDDGQPEQDGVI